MSFLDLDPANPGSYRSKETSRLSPSASSLVQSSLNLASPAKAVENGLKRRKPSSFRRSKSPGLVRKESQCLTSFSDAFWGEKIQGFDILSQNFKNHTGRML